MRRSIIIFGLTALLLTNCLVGIALGTEKEGAISRAKLCPEALPPGMSIEREVRASMRQLFTTRLRVGFPLTALLNQAMLYDHRRAQVNYLTVPTVEWFRVGYTKLIALDGRKSLVLTKNGVIIQIASSTKELEDRIIGLLDVDFLQQRKIRTHRVKEKWILTREQLLQPDALHEIGEKVGVQPENGLAQEFLVNRAKLKIKYYNCGSFLNAGLVANRLASDTNPMLKQSVQYCGPLVVMAESHDSDLNAFAMSLVHW